MRPRGVDKEIKDSVSSVQREDKEMKNSDPDGDDVDKTI